MDKLDTFTIEELENEKRKYTLLYEQYGGSWKELLERVESKLEEKKQKVY